MLTLYHADTAVCAAKVRVTLVEKNLHWDSRMLDLGRGDQFTAEYLTLNKNGVVPTLVHDGIVITESTVINEYLDERFPEIPLRPLDAAGRARMRLWTKREDSIHDAINTMTVVLLFRPDLLQKTAEEQAKRYQAIPDPTRRQKWRDLLEHGLGSSHVRDALLRLGRLFSDMEQALKDCPWLLGEERSLADLGLVSFFYRLELMQMAATWREPFPRVSAWLERCKARPSFEAGIARYIAQSRIEHSGALCAASEAAVNHRFREALTNI